MNRSIWLASSAPEILLSTFPHHRVLNDVFLYFSAWASDLDNSLVYESVDLSVLDEDGATMPLPQLLGAIATLLYSNTELEIRITNAQAKALQELPHWSLFLGDYTDKDDLQADVTAAGLGITLDKSQTISTLITQARTALRNSIVDYNG